MVKVHVQGYDTRGRLQISRFPPPPLQSPHSPASPLPSSSPSSVTPANQVSEAQEHSSVPDDDSTISIAFKKKFRANLKVHVYTAILYISLESCPVINPSANWCYNFTYTAVNFVYVCEKEREREDDNFYTSMTISVSASGC